MTSGQVKVRFERSRSREVQTANIRVDAARDSAERLHLVLPQALDRLARLMIQYEVGVRARKTCILRSVDEDYFSDF